MWYMYTAYFFFFFSFFPLHLKACEISVPWPGIQPEPPALEAQSLNHWTTREVILLFVFCSTYLSLNFYSSDFFWANQIFYWLVHILLTCYTSLNCPYIVQSRGHTRILDMSESGTRELETVYTPWCVFCSPVLLFPQTFFLTDVSTCSLPFPIYLPFMALSILL